MLDSVTFPIRSVRRYLVRFLHGKHRVKAVIILLAQHFFRIHVDTPRGSGIHATWWLRSDRTVFFCAVRNVLSIYRAQNKTNIREMRCTILCTAPLKSRPNDTIQI